jgi:predicted small secreted protein
MTGIRREGIWVALVGSAMLAACDPTSTPSVGSKTVEPEAGGPTDRDADAPSCSETGSSVPDSGVLGSWCCRAGPTPSEQDCVMVAIADEYFARQYGDCETQALTSSMSNEESVAWSSYLIGYTYRLAGCNTVVGYDAPDGIRAFGPANVAAIGLARPRLAREDAEQLIQQYLLAFCTALHLSDAECRQVERQLRSTAEMEIDPASRVTLSTCAGNIDAGRDAGR